MKLRVAKKVVANIGTEHEPDYRDNTLHAANIRIKKLKSTKEDNRFWFALMDKIGPAGRAYIIRRELPAEALKLYMQSENSFLEPKQEIVL